MTMLHKVSNNLTFYSLLSLTTFLFISLTVLSLNHIFLLVPAIYFLLHRSTRNSGLSISQACLLLLIAQIFLSYLANYDIMPAKNLFKAKYLIFSFLAIGAYTAFFQQKRTNKYQKQLKILLGTILVTATIATIGGIIAKYTGFHYLRMKDACHPVRACGMYGMYMDYGHNIHFFLILLSGLILHHQKWQKYLPFKDKKVLIIIFIINFLGLYLSYTRGAMLGLLLALPFFFFRKHQKLFPIIILGMFSIFILSFVFSSKMQNMFMERNRFDSIKTRLSSFQAAIHVAQERPIFGLGHKNFEHYSSEYKYRYQLFLPHLGGHAHNNYFEYLGSLGIPGFFLLILFTLSWILEMYKRRDIIGDLIFPLTISFAVTGLSQYTIGNAANSFLLFNIYALSQIPNKEKALLTENK